MRRLLLTALLAVPVVLAIACSSNETPAPPGGSALPNAPDGSLASGSGSGSGTGTGDGTGPPAAGQAGDVTVGLSAVRLGDERCTHDESRDVAPQSCVAPTDAGPHGTGLCGGPCKFTNVQLAFDDTKAAGAPPSHVAIGAVTLLDAATEKELETLSAYTPLVWDGAQYVAWDETIAAGAQLKTSYTIAPPQWSTLGNDYGTPYKIRIVVVVDGASITLESESLVRDSARRDVKPAARPRAFVLGAVLLVTAGCRTSRPDASTADAAPADDAAVLAEGARYLDDPTFRRAALVGSLTNPANTYAAQRLGSYGLGTRGWDQLPVWNPRSVVMTRAWAATIAAGERPRPPPGTPPLWDGLRPTDMAGWVALGRETFFRYPLRREVVAEWALVHPVEAARGGVVATEDGVLPGVVGFTDVNGLPQVGITCAICHADVVDGRIVVGRARRSFDYGALRLAYHASTGVPVDGDLARRMRTWGPGRADVTEDDDEDPVAVPDLWGLREQPFLTQAGTLKHTPAALAIRQETQLLTSNHQVVRPPRELAFALAMFLYALRPPPPSPQAAPTARGRALFEHDCAGCHANPSGGGGLVRADLVDTDRALANGHARGTGHYRTPALLRVGAAAPYLHDGSVATLEDLLSADRLEPSFRGGVFGPGPVRGHRFGTDLPRDDRAALVTYLRAL